MATLSFYLGTKHMGTTTINPRYNPMSLAYFCPVCGDVWGRIVVDRAAWRCDIRSCPKHRKSDNWAMRSGMFLSIWSHSKPELEMWPDPNMLDFLPRGVLIHDFLTISENLDAFIQTEIAAD